MAIPLPLVLQCSTCDFFQGDANSLTNGTPTQGKCRKASPEPKLVASLSALTATWATVQQTDSCSFHSQSAEHPTDVPDLGGGPWPNMYIVTFTPKFGEKAPAFTRLLRPSEFVRIMNQSSTFTLTITASGVMYTCKTCLYWKADVDPATGTCHRMAPKPADGADGVLAANWLTTLKNDWCSYSVPLPDQVEAQARASTNFGGVTTPN